MLISDLCLAVVSRYRRLRRGELVKALDGWLAWLDRVKFMRVGFGRVAFRSRHNRERHAHSQTLTEIAHTCAGMHTRTHTAEPNER